MKKFNMIINAALLFFSITSISFARASWYEDSFPPPNGGWLVYTFIDGNPACASYDAKNCLWGQSKRDIDFAEVRPLICGKMHRRLYGVYGFENPKHWCSLIEKKHGIRTD